MSIARHHTEWLALVESSGPFLSLPVLMRVFPQGLDAHDSDMMGLLRSAAAEWELNRDSSRPDSAMHRQWVRFVLQNVLGLPDEVIAEGQTISPGLTYTAPEHHETLRPDLVVANPAEGPSGGKPRLLVQILDAAQNLDTALKGSNWNASPAARMMELMHATGVHLGLVTNGEQWMFINAKVHETTGYASWYTAVWQDEPLTLRAFCSVLGRRRFFEVSDGETLEALLDQSAADQQEVTDQLGYQVRQAVEILIQAIDRIDKDRGRQLLQGVDEKGLYEAALTVMMRLVFLFAAEERGMLRRGESLYDESYAISTLRSQLREDADHFGEEILERRYDGWSRLLATFRAVYGGVQHDDIALPAYGGGLFDPDRYPFLEGRQVGSKWRETPAAPLTIHNRTVLHLLDALQVLRVRIPGGGPAQARVLSFRALDVEQIGHVYEGLLDHTAVRASEPILGLMGSKDYSPEVPLSTLEQRRSQGETKLIAYLKEATGKTEKAITTALKPQMFVDDQRLRVACDNDEPLLERVRPFAALIRPDSMDYPVVIARGSIYVTQGSDRRSTGAHYTPRSLTEPIVQYALEPIVYEGPAEGKTREEWRLRSAKELLSIKVCDMAMGSGAFLVPSDGNGSAEKTLDLRAAHGGTGHRICGMFSGERY